VALAGLGGPPEAAEFMAHFTLEEIEFTATSAVAFPHPPQVSAADQHMVRVAFTDFPVDLQDVAESLGVEVPFQQQAARAGGTVVWVVFDLEKRGCRVETASRVRIGDPRFSMGGLRAFELSRGAALVVGRRRVRGACEGEAPIVTPTGRTVGPIRFSAAYEGPLTDLPDWGIDLREPSGTAQAWALQALVQAAAARDLPALQRLLSKDQWPVDAGDPRALEAYFKWLGHTYPSEAVVTEVRSNGTAARLLVEGRKQGRRVRGSVSLRRVAGEWKITGAFLPWQEWPWDVPGR
jgi:hypothetical protein